MVANIDIFLRHFLTSNSIWRKMCDRGLDNIMQNSQLKQPLSWLWFQSGIRCHQLQSVFLNRFLCERKTIGHYIGRLLYSFSTFLSSRKNTLWFIFHYVNNPFETTKTFSQCQGDLSKWMISCSVSTTEPPQSFVIQHHWSFTNICGFYWFNGIWKWHVRDILLSWVNNLLCVWVIRAPTMGWG